MRALTAVFVLLLVGLAGCNTDPVWEPRQRVAGPTADIDDPQGVDLPDIRIADVQEVDLVEQLVFHRAMYYRSVKALSEYYRQHGYYAKRRWAERELDDLNRVKTFRYLLAAEIPADDLVPRDSIAEADELYERGLSVLKRGGHGTPVLYSENKMREALGIFRELIERYPSSDKIDDAAFYCGEIHKEYFKGEEPIAVRWYERAFTWAPNTPHPARFQAAVVYDYRMHDRARALELYHQVIEHEQAHKSNVHFAVRRIEQLTRDVQPASIRSEPSYTPASAPPSGEEHEPTGGSGS